MKNLYFLIIILIIYSSVFAIPHSQNSKVRLAINNGEWTDPKVWSDDILPLAGDSITIPSNYTISISDKVDYLPNAQVPNIIEVHGKLIFFGTGKLILPTGSIIHIQSTGAIENESLNNSTDRIRIGNSIYFTSNDENLHGPFIIKRNSVSSTFTDLSVAFKHHEALIQWTTMRGCTIHHFELQRNIDGENWETISTIQSEINNQSNTYHFIDKDKSAIIANYRLKIYENNGMNSLSTVKSIRHNETGPNICIGGRPTGSLVVHFSKQISSSLIFKLENLSGEVIHSKIIWNPVGDIDIKLKDVTPGNYMATVSGPFGFRYIQPVKL